MKKTAKKFTAVYRRTGKWYSGWIEEIPGVNTQGETLSEVKENLKDALFLLLESARAISKKENLGRRVIRESLVISL